MSEVMGITSNLLIEMVNDPEKNKSDEIRVLRTRFQSYVDTYGRAAIEADLAKPPYEREIIKFAEIADCAQLWLNEPTARESSERMIKVLMVSAVMEVALTVSMSLDLLPFSM